MTPLEMRDCHARESVPCAVCRVAAFDNVARVQSELKLHAHVYVFRCNAATTVLRDDGRRNDVTATGTDVKESWKITRFTTSLIEK